MRTVPSPPQLRVIADALEGLLARGVHVACGARGDDVAFYAPPGSDVIPAVSGLLDRAMWVVYALLHELEARSGGTRRCADCHDRLPRQRHPAALCAPCQTGALPLRRLYWLQYGQAGVCARSSRLN